MKGWWILAGLTAAAAALAVLLAGESSADVERMYEEAVRERAAIEAALAESGELVRYFADRKPTERKKSELEELRRRLDALEKAAGAARDDESRPRDERKKTLGKLEQDFYQLRVDAEDLRARLREMKRFDGELSQRIRRLGELTRALSDAQKASTDPEFQQRSGNLLEDARKFRQMAESGFQTLGTQIVAGRQLTETALNELDDVMKRMEELLAARS